MSSAKVTVIGGGGIGKSCLCIRFVNEKFITKYNPTIEDSYRKTIDIDGDPVVVNILDTAGQEEFSALRDTYLRDGDAFILVYAIDNRASFAEAERLHEYVVRVKETDKIPFVLVGNKCDLSEDQREVTTQQGQELAAKWDVPFLESSAKENINVREVFEQSVRLTLKAQESSGKGKKEKKKFKCTIF